MIDQTWSNQKNNQKSKKLVFNLIKYSFALGLIIVMILSIINYRAIDQYFYYKIHHSFSSNLITIESQINQIAKIQQDFQYRNDYLIIPKIDLNMQIFWNIKETGLDITMKKGVTHFPNSNLPGENGNLILLGYSSLPWWQDQGGGTVFTLISQLIPGDRININYENNYYVYSVSSKKTTNKKIVFDLVDKPALILITFSPISIGNQKTVITAEQISTSKKEPASTNSSTINQLTIP